MFNAKRIEDIRNKITASKLLSDTEKSDWLSLLELMNDKQLTELEEILAAETPVVNPAATNVVEEIIPITNPADFDKPTPPSSAPIRPPASQSAPQPQTKPPVAPPVKPPAPRPAPQPPHRNQSADMPQLTHIANIPPGVRAGQASNTSVSARPVRPQSVSAPAPAPQPVTAAPETAAPESTTPYVLEHPDDLKLLTPSSLRDFSKQSLVDAIRESIKQHGYFQILQLLEESPLYESYIESGKSLLQEKSAPLTQAEFEFMTDLLSHMRFNRW